MAEMKGVRRRRRKPFLDDMRKRATGGS
jgi:hypothetical protein